MNTMIDFPHIRQADAYSCGVTIMQAMLVFYGVNTGVDCTTLRRIGGTNQKGTSIFGLQKIAQYYGLSFEVRAMTIEEVQRFLRRGVPVILNLQAWPQKPVDLRRVWRQGHYAVAIGYDEKRMYFADPASFERTFLTYPELLARWHDTDQKLGRVVQYGIIVRGKKKAYRGNRIVRME